MKQTPEILEAVAIQLGYANATKFDRRTVWLLMRHIEALNEELVQAQADERLAVKNADRMYDELLTARSARDRLIENVSQLQQEKQRLQEEVDEARAAKKVTLPREVAEAIERCESAGYTKYGIIADLQMIKMLGRDYQEQVLTDLETVKQFAASKAWSGVDTLMAALVNGYTVEEQTIEKQLEQRIFEKLWEWDCLPVVPDSKREDELKFAAEMIAEIVISDHSETMKMNG